MTAKENLRSGRLGLLSLFVDYLYFVVHLERVESGLSEMAD